MEIEVLRIGQRVIRDDRVTTHVALVARAFGASKIYMNEVDPEISETIQKINSTWGGNIVDMVRFCHIMDAIENDNLVQNAKTVGEYLLGKLVVVDGISNVRGKGLMIAFTSFIIFNS